MEENKKNAKRKEMEKRIKADYAIVGKEILDQINKNTEKKNNKEKQDKDYEK